MNDSSCLWQEKEEERGGGRWTCGKCRQRKRKLSLSSVPKDFLPPCKHRINPVAEIFTKERQAQYEMFVLRY